MTPLAWLLVDLLLIAANIFMFVTLRRLAVRWFLQIVPVLSVLPPLYAAAFQISRLMAA